MQGGGNGATDEEDSKGPATAADGQASKGYKVDLVASDTQVARKNDITSVFEVSGSEGLTRATTRRGAG